jgi:tRNA (cytidine/uridine-2'-O-)-methyltransferase
MLVHRHAATSLVSRAGRNSSGTPTTRRQHPVIIVVFPIPRHSRRHANDTAMADDSRFDIVLYQPEIPPNTGNVIRLCANTGARLHLIEPLGFDLSDKQLRRAGLDYHEYADVRVHSDLTRALEVIAPKRLFALSTRGTTRYDRPPYRLGDTFLFGPETRGLPGMVLDTVPVAQRLRLPMCPGNRSLNLSNAVAIVLFEAWRQNGFIAGQ